MSASYAEEINFNNGYDVALKAGTLGVGIDVSTMVSPMFGIRGNLNGASYNDNRDAGDLNYDTDINFFSIGLIGDYHPFSGSFRMSGGLYYNDNAVTGNFTPRSNETFQLGDHTYSASEIGKVTTDIEWENTISPYLGIGWGNNSNAKGWGFSFDVGALYQGTTQITTTPNINASVPAAERAQIQADANRETKTIEDDISDYTWYPVLSIGVTYAF